MEPPTQASVDAIRSGVLSWANENRRSYPWRDANSPYQVLIAEMLLQKTFADKVKPVYEEFVSRYPDLECLASANVDELASLLEPLGLQNVRARAMIDIANERAGAGIPETEEALLQLPYVGPYAANATLCFAFDRRRPIVDANVVRIYNRAFGLDLDPQDDDAWELADRVLPEDDFQRFNLGLIDFGAKVCSAHSPRCSTCIVRDQCTYYAEESRP